MSYPVPTLCLASALLLVVAGWDIARRRIPNWANAALGVTGLAAQFIYLGGLSALQGFLAALITLALLWKPWTKRMLGGGDVKATLCAATWLSLGLLTKYFLFAAVAAGVFGVLSYLASARHVRSEIRENLRLAAMRNMPDAPMKGGNGRASVPFGAAAAAAAMLILWWP